VSAEPGSLARPLARLGLVVALASCGGLVSCGGTPARTVTAVQQEPEPEPPPVAPPASEGTIARAELDGMLDAGLGHFLQRVATEPHLDEGRFVGHRVTRLRGDLFGGVDLQPGDTLLRVNGMPIERPEHALAAWNALRVASELTIDLLREGERRQLRFAIEE
jgi:type II secretory pathway component PulC